MRSPPRAASLAAWCLAALCLCGTARAWELAGTKQVALRTRDGARIPIGTVTFTPQGAGARFSLALDPARMTDFFLSMREFKCVEGPEVQCHVPYPYANPRTVTPGDMTWLEHSLIFFYKTPSDFGAVLRNGLYYGLTRTEDGLAGTPSLVDLNDIAAPPQDPAVAPFGPAERTPIDPESRWIAGIEIR